MPFKYSPSLFALFISTVFSVETLQSLGHNYVK